MNNIKKIMIYAIRKQRELIATESFLILGTLVMIHLLSPGVLSPETLPNYIASWGICFIAIPVAFTLLIGIFSLFDDTCLAKSIFIPFTIAIPFAVFELGWWLWKLI